VKQLAWALDDARNYRWQLALLAVLSCAEIALRVLFLWPMKAVVDNALGDGAVPAWLSWIPPATMARERLLAEVVLAGFLIQVAHQGILMLHTRQYSRTGHRLTRSPRCRRATTRSLAMRAAPSPADSVSGSAWRAPSSATRRF
jgi:hypothetical protein